MDSGWYLVRAGIMIAAQAQAQAQDLRRLLTSRHAKAGVLPRPSICGPSAASSNLKLEPPKVPSARARRGRTCCEQVADLRQCIPTTTIKDNDPTQNIRLSSYLASPVACLLYLLPTTLTHRARLQLLLQPPAHHEPL